MTHDDHSFRARRRRPLPVAAAALLLAACSGGGGWTGAATPDAVDAQRRQTAERARDALAGRLLAELSEALADGGPASGIRVCAERAPEIAAAVGEEHGVRIGRTSFRLRNPDNVPPSWAADAVAEKVDTPRFFTGEDGAVAALYPIRLGSQCVMCHGLEGAIQPDVREALAEHYPDDRATGFAPGDLRGWFWVEVP